MIHWLAQFLHPGKQTPGGSYWFFSGIGPGVADIPVLGGIFLWWHHHNCHEKGCWHKGHPDPKHGHPVCKKHSPHFKEGTL